MKLDTLGIAEAMAQRLEAGAEKAAKKALKQCRTAASIELAAYVRTFTAHARKFNARAIEAQRQGDMETAKAWARHALRALTNLDRINKAAAS